MSLRVCAEPGCPTLGPAARCIEHRRERERQRGTRQQRGYDAAHDQAQRTPEYLAATHCTTCGQPFTSGNPKTAGHIVAIRNGGRDSGIEAQCRRCNYGWLKTGN